jgi:hypothetical protein
VAGKERPINTGLSKHRSRAVTTPEAAAQSSGHVLTARTY